jgi:S-adenosylmethionine synthetase
VKKVEEIFSFKPADMIKQLDLLKPIYRKTTHYGHFTKSDLPWERLDQERINKLRSLIVA